MAITIENTTGGSYSGFGGKPNGTAGNGLTALIGDVIFLISYTSRVLAAGNFDTHVITSIDVPGGGVTFTKILSQAYQYQEASGSFPACSCHVDIFVGVVTSNLTNESYSSTATGNDTFINDGWFAVETIRGLDTTTILDTFGSNPKFDTNVSNSVSTPNLSSFDILASESILWSIQFMHGVGGTTQPTVAPPTGFTVPGSGAGSHFKAENTAASQIDGCASYKIFSSAQGGLSVSPGSGTNDWFMALIALRGAGATVANTKRSFATVVN